MSRSLIFFDRIVVFLFGAALIAGGVFLVLWWSDVIDQNASLAPASLDGLSDNVWWPWATGGAGIVLFLLGAAWLLQHLKRSSVKELRLPGSGVSGRLETETGPVVDGAAEHFESLIGVRSARGRVLKDRGQLVAEIVARVEPSADLAYLSSQADETAATVKQMLGRDDLAVRVTVRPLRHGKALPKVS